MKKVRVYDFESRKMWLADGYDELSELFMALNTDDSLYSEPMQSTGLLDKNGDDIYESDIVEWEHKDTGQLVRGIVKYDTELGFWGMTDARFNDLTAIGYLANQRVTVLGDICGNPELVEVE